jgi:hypothetical protein
MICHDFYPIKRSCSTTKQTDDNDHYKVFDFARNYIEGGQFDSVTGFSSMNALALLKNEVNQKCLKLS